MNIIDKIAHMAALGLMFRGMANTKPAAKTAPPKVIVVPGKIFAVTPGGRHAWHESNVGPIRKPYPLEK